MNRAAMGLVLILSGCQSRPLQTSLEPLPELNTKAFLPAIRSKIDKALATAKQNPKDACADGELEMLLHAHRENAAAEACYLRAVAAGGLIQGSQVLTERTAGGGEIRSDIASGQHRPGHATAGTHEIGALEQQLRTVHIYEQYAPPLDGT